MLKKNVYGWLTDATQAVPTDPSWWTADIFEQKALASVASVKKVAVNPATSAFNYTGTKSHDEWYWQSTPMVALYLKNGSGPFGLPPPPTPQAPHDQIDHSVTEYFATYSDWWIAWRPYIRLTLTVTGDVVLSGALDIGQGVGIPDLPPYKGKTEGVLYRQRTDLPVWKSPLDPPGTGLAVSRGEFTFTEARVSHVDADPDPFNFQSHISGRQYSKKFTHQDRWTRTINYNKSNLVVSSTDWFQLADVWVDEMIPPIGPPQFGWIQAGPVFPNPAFEHPQEWYGKEYWDFAPGTPGFGADKIIPIPSVGDIWTPLQPDTVTIHVIGQYLNGYLTGIIAPGGKLGDIPSATPPFLYTLSFEVREVDSYVPLWGFFGFELSNGVFNYPFPDRACSHYVGTGDPFAGHSYTDGAVHFTFQDFGFTNPERSDPVKKLSPYKYGPTGALTGLFSGPFKFGSVNASGLTESVCDIGYPIDPTVKLPLLPGAAVNPGTHIFETLDKEYIWAYSTPPVSYPGLSSSPPGTTNKDFYCDSFARLKSFFAAPIKDLIAWRNQWKDVRILCSPAYAKLDLLPLKPPGTGAGAPPIFGGPRVSFYDSLATAFNGGHTYPPTFSAKEITIYRNPNAQDGGMESLTFPLTPGQYPLKIGGSQVLMPRVLVNDWNGLTMASWNSRAPLSGPNGNDPIYAANPWLDWGPRCDDIPEPTHGRTLIFIDPSIKANRGNFLGFITEAVDVQSQDQYAFEQVLKKSMGRPFIVCAIPCIGLQDAVSFIKTLQSRDPDIFRLPVTWVVAPAEKENEGLDPAFQRPLMEMCAVGGAFYSGIGGQTDYDAKDAFFQLQYSRMKRWPGTVTPDKGTQALPHECSPLVLLCRDDDKDLLDVAKDPPEGPAFNPMKFSVAAEIRRYDGTYHYHADSAGTMNPKGGTLCVWMQDLMANFRGRPRNVALVGYKTPAGVDWQVIRARNFLDLDGAQTKQNEWSDTIAQDGTMFGQSHQVGDYMISLKGTIFGVAQTSRLSDQKFWLAANYETDDALKNRGVVVRLQQWNW